MKLKEVAKRKRKEEENRLEQMVVKNAEK